MFLWQNLNLKRHPSALEDGDMAQEDATVLGALLEKNVANLAPEKLKAAVSEITTAYSMFE